MGFMHRIIQKAVEGRGEGHGELERPGLSDRQKK